MFNTLRIKLQIDKREIVYLNSVIDSYEGIAIMRTIDKNLGKVIIYTTEKFEILLDNILSALKGEGVHLEIIEKDKSELIDNWN
jgi:hypothetical protein